MLYQDRILGRQGLWQKLAAGLAIGSRGRKAADLDLLALSPHLRRDLGLEGRLGAGTHWRK